jgi:hypothetical protein
VNYFLLTIALVFLVGCDSKRKEEGAKRGPKDGTADAKKQTAAKTDAGAKGGDLPAWIRKHGFSRIPWTVKPTTVALSPDPHRLARGGIMRKCGNLGAGVRRKRLPIKDLG